MFIPFITVTLMCTAIWQPVLVWGICAILIAVLFALIVMMTQAIHKRRVVYRLSKLNDPSRTGSPAPSSSGMSTSEKLLQAQQEALRRRTPPS